MHVGNLTAAALLLAAGWAHAAPVRSTASANIQLGSTPLMGVNLSGCEFLDNGALCPTPEMVNIYLDKGFRVLRIPFRARQVGNPAVVGKLQAAVAAATRRNAYVILDRHDFGSTFDPAQAAWWAGFIRHFPDSSRVMIDTMNEPQSGAPYERDPKTGKSYASEVNAGIAAFRRAGFKHMLLIEWRGWSGMQRFDKGETANQPCSSPACSFDRVGGLKDPLGRTMISGHRYPDADGSGTSPICKSWRIGPFRTGGELVANTDKAAAARGLKIWVGEFAFGSARKLDPVCHQIGKGFIARMRSMHGTYAGVSWWGGGNGWKEDYLYKVEPQKGSFATAAPSPYLLTITGR